MKRAALTVALALGFVVSSWTGDAQAGGFTDAKRERYCRFESWDGLAGFSHYEVHLTIHCALHHFPAGHRTADAVAYRESGLDCKAQNPLSSAAGVYQVIDSTWDSWWRAISPRFQGWGLHDNRLLCRANVLVAIVAAHRWGWGPWQ